MHTNERHRFLKNGFQPVNSYQYTTAAIHERDKYSWHQSIYMYQMYIHEQMACSAFNSVCSAAGEEWIIFSMTATSAASLECLCYSDYAGQ